MSIEELKEMFAQEAAQEATEPPDGEETDDPIDDEPEAAETTVRLDGVVVTAAKRFINTDTGLPMCQFVMSPDFSVDDFGEISIQVQGSGLVEFAARHFGQGARVLVEGLTFVTIDTDGDQTLWLDASMIGIVAQN